MSASWYTSTQFAPSNKPLSVRKVYRSETKRYPNCEATNAAMAKNVSLKTFERETLG